MSFLAIDLALFEKLSGAPLDSKGRPELDDNKVPVNRTVIGPVGCNLPETHETLKPSYGVRIPLPKRPQKDSSFGLKGTQQSRLKLFDQGWEPHTFTQVPIFDINIEGRQWEDVFPRVSYYWSDLDFEPDTYVYADPIVSLIGGNASISSDFVGEIQTGKSKQSVRPHPESWNFTYVIRTYAKTLWETMWMCRQIVHLFKARDALLVRQADGSTRAFDMIYQSHANLDTGERDIPMSRESKEQRFFSRAFYYTIEGYIDNSVNGFGTEDIFERNVILHRMLKMFDARNGLLVEPCVDVNLLEHGPITA